MAYDSLFMSGEASPTDRAAQPPPAARARVLVVDDVAGMRQLLAEELAGFGFEIVACGTFGEASARLSEVDALVTDVHLGGANGLDLAAVARARRPPMPVVVMSGDASTRVVAEAEQLGATYLPKPFAVVEVARILQERLALPRG